MKFHEVPYHRYFWFPWQVLEAGQGYHPKKALLNGLAAHHYAASVNVPWEFPGLGQKKTLRLRLSRKIQWKINLSVDFPSLNTRGYVKSDAPVGEIGLSRSCP